MSGGRLGEGQDLGTRKGRWGWWGRKQGPGSLCCSHTYSPEEELLRQGGRTGVAELRAENHQPAAETHQDVFRARGELQEGAQPLELGWQRGQGH